MGVILVGLNHLTAPVALRERLALSNCALEDVLGDATVRLAASDPAGLPGIDEYVLLSTCNRLEMYALTGNAEHGFAVVEERLADLLGVSVPQLRPHLYWLEERAAVEHLFRVASGMDSMILGEPQILGQVARAHERAREGGSEGVILRQLFVRAVHAGRRARSETGISRHTTSVSHAAVRLARTSCGDLAHAAVTIVGSGEIAEQAALALTDEGARNITCVSRTYEHAEELARRFDGRALSWGYLSGALADSDVVIYEDDVAPALPRPQGAPLVIVDIAVPRNVAPEVGNLPGVVYYNIDHVQAAVDTNRAQREAALPRVEAIVQEETEEFFLWLHGREVAPVLLELRRKAETVAQSELELMLRRLVAPDEHTREVMALLAHRIVGKLLHDPNVRLKAEAANGNGAIYAEALRELFGLDGLAETPEEDTEPGSAGTTKPPKRH